MHAPEWAEDTIAAFDNIKDALANTSLLVHPISDVPTSVMTDAAVGAVLEQHINGQWYPLAFFSRALKPAETRYSTYDRELLAIYLAIKHFGYFLCSQTINLWFTHSPLASIAILLGKSDTLTSSVNSPLTYVMCRDQPIQQLTPSPASVPTLSTPSCGLSGISLGTGR